MPAAIKPPQGEAGVATRQPVAAKPATRPKPPPLDIARVMQVADILFQGGITGGAPTKAAVAARIIAGHAVGLNEVQAVTNIMVQAGKASVWGDAMPALVRGSGLLASYEERESGTPHADDWTFTVTASRVGDSSPPTVRAFSVSDAKTAGLWGKKSKDGKPTPWVTSPARMLLIRARSFVFRDLFGDVLAGLGCTEEVIDTAEVLAVRERQPEPTPAPLPSLALPAVANPAPAPVTPTDPDGKVSEDMLQEIAAARIEWLKATEIDQTDAANIDREWKGFLFLFNTDKASKLSNGQARNLLAVLKKRTVEAGQFVAGKLDTETQAAALFGGEPEPSPTSTDAAAGDAA